MSKEKRTFDFSKIVTYRHCIEFEIDEEDAVDAESALDDICDKIDSGDYDSVEGILHDFRKAFGESVDFVRDGSPDVEYWLC